MPPSHPTSSPSLLSGVCLWGGLTSFTGFGVCCDLPRHISCRGLSFVAGQKSMPISRARPATATNTPWTHSLTKTMPTCRCKLQTPLHLKVCTHTERGYMEHVRAAMFRKATFRMHFTNKESNISQNLKLCCLCCCYFLGGEGDVSG